jgi:endo-1,4-beta-xylanase
MLGPWPAPLLTRRALLASGAASLVMPAFAQTPSLAQLAAANGIVFGTAAASYELRDADFPPLLARQAAMLVPEYEMKRHVVEPRPGVYDFSGIDTLMAFARAHNMAFRGHPLVWYAANPPWLEEMVLARRDEKLLTAYVAALAGRYRGRMHSLDVVNEALAEDGSGLRQSFWLKAFGASYMDMAFHAARAADPTALLVYNDYGCEAGGMTGDRVRANCLKLLDGLIARGAPVQALGLQSHLFAFGEPVNPKKLRDFLTEVAARGLAILATELDVSDQGGPSDIGVRDQAVADAASRYLDVVLDNRKTVAVLTWGLSDRYADPPASLRLKMTGWRMRKFPFDAALRPKPLAGALGRAFSARRPA